MSQINKNLLAILIPFSIIAIVSSKYLSTKISSPLENLENIVRNFSNEGILSKQNKSESNYIYEFMALEKFVYDSFDLYQKNHYYEMEFAKMATQVAHDIKSPMIALNNYFKELLQADAIKSEVIESSLNRINEIANNLLLQHKKLNQPNQQSYNEIEMVFPILEWIIAEKKMQFNNLPITIDFIFDHYSETACAFINSENFKRVISNLINNSIESIDGKGSVIVSLKKKLNSLIVEIKDTGCGIPDTVLSKIEQGYTFGKTNGNGLGLSHAIKSIKEWGAKYHIDTKENSGTKVTIILPIQNYPSWMETDLYIYDDLNIVIVDDDHSIYNLWKEKFTDNLSDIKIGNLTYLKNPEELQNHVTKTIIDFNKTIFLIDYHYKDSSQTGIEEIQKFSLEKNSILVTSQYPDNLMRKLIEQMKIKMIFKTNIPEIQINKIFKNPDLILLDDKKLVTKTWQIESKKHNKKIVTFNNKEVFMRYIDLFDKKVSVYLDSHLGEEKGEEIARELYEMGFSALYLSTGYESKKFVNMPWIKGIIGKEPPFSNKFDASIKQYD
ncbi:MAG: ATP-binding protein [Gammaproteobacteria bacterium]